MQYLVCIFMHSALIRCHCDTHSYRQHGVAVRVELCVDWLLLAELRQNVNGGPFYVFLHCAADGCSDVSEKRTATETLQKSSTARRKIPTDHKLNNCSDCRGRAYVDSHYFGVLSDIRCPTSNFIQTTPLYTENLSLRVACHQLEPRAIT